MLSLLVLFAVLGVTYVLVSGQFRRTSTVPARLEQRAVDYRNQLDGAAMQILRGPNSLNSTSSPGLLGGSLSVIGPHSLLEDIYGNDAVASSSTSVTTNPTGITIYSAESSFQNAVAGQTTQLIDLTLKFTTGSGGSAVSTPSPLPWPLADLYSGVNGSGNPNQTTPSQPISGQPPYFQGNSPNSSYTWLPNSTSTVPPTLAAEWFFQWLRPDVPHRARRPGKARGSSATTTGLLTTANGGYDPDQLDRHDNATSHGLPRQSAMVNATSTTNVAGNS